MEKEGEEEEKGRMRTDRVSSLLISLLALAGVSSAGILPDGFLPAAGGPKNPCSEVATATTTVTVEAIRQTVTATTTYTVSSVATCSAVGVPAPVVTGNYLNDNGGNAGNTNVDVNVANCLSDEQAKSIVDAFKKILTSPDRSVAKSTADQIIADEFLETSDSVNSLNGLPVSISLPFGFSVRFTKGYLIFLGPRLTNSSPGDQQQLGSTTFPSKDAFVNAMGHAPAIPTMTTLDVFHMCGRIAWYWSATAVKGTVAGDVRGFTVFYVTPDQQQVSMAMMEFNSLHWAKLLGWKVGKPDGSVY